MISRVLFSASCVSMMLLELGKHVTDRGEPPTFLYAISIWIMCAAIYLKEQSE